MPPAIDAVLDHVAIAVPADGDADRRWGADLGAGTVSGGDNGTFQARQYRFANGAKLELLSPSEADPSAGNFVRRFLDRFGSTVHHVTLKVPDLGAALDVLEAAGLDVVDVDRDDRHWQEAFLRPKQVGGLVVQVAWTPQSDEEWAQAVGYRPTPARPGAPELLGPRLRHPDLDTAARLWAVLGAAVERAGDALRARWPDSPLDVVVERGEPAGPTALRVRPAPAGTPDGDRLAGLGGAHVGPPVEIS